MVTLCKSGLYMAVHGCKWLEMAENGCKGVDGCTFVDMAVNGCKML